MKYRLYTLYRLLSSILLTRGIFLLFLVQQKKLTILQATTCQSLYFILITFFEIPTGYIGDRFGKSRSLMFGCILTFLQYVGLLLSPPKIIGYIYMCVFFEALGNSFFSGTESAFLYELLEKDSNEKEYLDLNSKIMFLSSIVISLSIFIGGYVSEVSWNYVYIPTIIIRFILIIVVLKLSRYEIRNNDINKRENLNTSFYLLKNSITYTPIYIYILIITSICLLDGFFQTYFNFNQIILNSFFVNNRWISLFFSIMYFTGSFAYLLGNVMHKKIGSKKSILFCIFILSIFYFLMSFNIDIKFFIVLSVGVCFIPEIIYILTDNFIQKNIKSDFRATILSIVSLITSFFASAYYLVLGNIFNNFNHFIMEKIFSICFLVIFILGVLFMKKYKGI
ncbi:MFS transporter [Fusobacterium pseudoperiodonticum]|uniref:MFS transporter n=1 Tax=Fusobacterium pseudoperiodonticum TaxID=2663009 RepID=UPI000C1B98CC|nr:MFS transporter [Fusobacterium pseudoperiodonticum]ATV68305.1 hypothetical protein CTM92_06635 [Fusobacterium pseudoperiodonticum]